MLKALISASVPRCIGQKNRCPKSQCSILKFSASVFQCLVLKKSTSTEENFWIALKTRSASASLALALIQIQLHFQLCMRVVFVIFFKTPSVFDLTSKESKAIAPSLSPTYPRWKENWFFISSTFLMPYYLTIICIKKSLDPGLPYFRQELDNSLHKLYKAS